MRKKHMANTNSYVVCILLFAATTINYLDRQVLSLLSPSLSKHFGWTNSDYASITAVFQVVYSVSMLVVGKAIDSVGAGRGYTITVIIWSLGAMMHAFAIPIGEYLTPYTL